MRLWNGWSYLRPSNTNQTTTSVSEKKHGLDEYAYLVVSIMKRAGISTGVLWLNDDSHSDDDNNKNGNKENYIASPVPPIIYEDSKKQQRLLLVLGFDWR